MIFKDLIRFFTLLLLSISSFIITIPIILVIFILELPELIIYMLSLRCFIGVIAYILYFIFLMSFIFKFSEEEG